MNAPGFPTRITQNPKPAYSFLRLLFLLSLYFLTETNVSAQRFFSVVFNQLPQSYQLYPRNEKDEANVPVSGIIEVAGYSHMSVIVTRNGAPLKYLRAPIRYNSEGIGSFATETTIKAELANYDFAVYACKSADSILMVVREKVVSGDAFVIMGQSNSTGFFSSTETSEFCRTFGAITGTLNTEAYNPADTLWAMSNTSHTTNVGTMGIEIQKELSKQSGIPNCLINGGFHWSSALSHANRNESNPADLHTPYGRMLYRVTKAGVSSVVRAFIYRQGESEAEGEGWNWEENFDKLYHNVKGDIPAVEKIYVFQIDIIYHPTLTGATLRDYQRRLPERYPDIRTLATVGTQAFDGLHYGREGNAQGGIEVSRLINRDLYDLQDTLNIDSPNLKKVFYKTPARTELVLVFDEGQQLIYPDSYKPNENVTLEMKDFFYLDDRAGPVSSGKAEGNRVLLTLKNEENARILHYLPPFLQEGGSYYPFTGPFLTNARGMRAFTFYGATIYDALETPTLAATVNGLTADLNWSAVPGVHQYKLERKKKTDSNWAPLATLTPTTTAFKDTPPAASAFDYRIKAISDQSESGAYGYAEAVFEVVAGIPSATGMDLPRIHPNPAKNVLTVEFGKPVSGILTVFDGVGRKIEAFELVEKSEVTHLPMWKLRQGYYLLRFESGELNFVRRVLVER